MTEQKIGFIGKLNFIKLKDLLLQIDNIEKEAPDEFKDQIKLAFTEDEDHGIRIDFYYNRPETEQELKEKEEYLNKLKEWQESHERAEFERLSKKFAKTT